jgi:predicted GNAT family acetyltransferase
MEVEAIAGADNVLERARELLHADEPRHNLALGILSTARAHPELYPEVRGWVVHEHGVVVGAAVQTPPFNLVLARPTDDRALEALSVGIDDELAGAVGAIPEVDRFARVWADRHALTVETRLEQGVYALRAVTRPRPTVGQMRLAEWGDRTLLLAWTRAFAAEALHGTVIDDSERQERSVDARLTGGDSGFGLWEVDDRPVSVAGFGGPTPNGIRIGPVYTPPELRGEGYASALTAAVSQLQLDRGRRFCFLFTDLSNPTSNAIYMRIGYQRVCDAREVAFVPRG